jgi:hypothetical protein
MSGITGGVLHRLRRPRLRQVGNTVTQTGTGAVTISGTFANVPATVGKTQPIYMMLKVFGTNVQNLKRIQLRALPVGESNHYLFDTTVDFDLDGGPAGRLAFAIPLNQFVLANGLGGATFASVLTFDAAVDATVTAEWTAVTL